MKTSTFLISISLATIVGLNVCSACHHQQADHATFKQKALDCTFAQNNQRLIENEEQHKSSTLDSLSHPYGIINLSVSNMRASASFSSEMLTQGLLGMPVRILSHSKKWYHVEMKDGYKIWCHPTGIHPVDSTTLVQWNHAKKIMVTAIWGQCFTHPQCGCQPISDVVAGDRLRYLGEKGRFYIVSYPDGRSGYLPKQLGMLESEWRNKIKKTGSAIVETARSVYGVPYLWAGTSPKGFDCSGLVQWSYRMHGIELPRDAYQQATIGQSHIQIANKCHNLLPGDLIFFGRAATDSLPEKISHVAIYMGNERFIHSQGDVHISSFNPKSPVYDAFNYNRRLFAGRIITNKNK
ncbi:MAG TPA: SH3 domain-containing C40 family peptidase [Bacteroidaceae bacterium]|nr:SH3 domain-containing C40 family peptidase [Bacteroidaceae bacterium]